MSFQLGFVTAYLFISIIVLIYFATYLMHKKKTVFSGLFLSLSFFIAVYLFGYMMELNSHTLDEALFWNRVQYVGLPFLSVNWLFFTLQYINKYSLLKAPVKQLLWIVPLVAMISRLTNRFHHLYYTGYQFVQAEPFPLLILEHGPLYYVLFIFHLLCFIANLVLITVSFIRAEQDEKKALLLIGISNLIPILGMIMMPIFSQRIGLDFAALLTPLSILLLSIPITGKNEYVRGLRINKNMPQMMEMITRVAYRQYLESALLFNLQQGYTSSDNNFFKDSVEYLSRTLDMEYVALHSIEEDKNTCIPLAVIHNGKFIDKDFQPDIQHFRDHSIANNNMCFYRRNVQHAFPNNKLLQDLKAESFIHVLLPNTSSIPVAIVTLISKKPKTTINLVKMVVDMIGIRIAVEIERIKSDQIIHESEEKYRLLVTRMNQGLAVFSIDKTAGKPSYKFLDVNPGFEKLTDTSKNGVIGKELLEVFPDLADDEVYHLEEMTTGNVNNLRVEMYFKKYDRHYEVLFYTPKSNQVATILSDITDRKKREAEILYVSNHDCITGLYNRTYFEKAKERLDTSENLPFSVIMGDINGLKLTNDIFGHNEGDKLLIRISDILTSCCGNKGIVSRIGGDEFGILLPNTTEEETGLLCEKIYQFIEEYESHKQTTTIYPGISLGYATKTGADEPIEKMIRNAESTMYRKKLLDKNKNLDKLMTCIKKIMLERTHESPDHIERLVALSKRLGTSMQLSREDLQSLEIVAVFHDIGKMNIDASILSKAEKLSDWEQSELQKYPEAGYRIALATPNLLPVAEYILCSHEHWDGKGYPQGLAGEDIPLISRIFSVVNAYEAMTQDRPYRKAFSHSEALAEIKKLAGIHFDPAITETFISMFPA